MHSTKALGLLYSGLFSDMQVCFYHHW